MRGLLKIFIFAIAMLLPCMVMGQDKVKAEFEKRPFSEFKGKQISYFIDKIKKQKGIYIITAYSEDNYFTIISPKSRTNCIRIKEKESYLLRLYSYFDIDENAIYTWSHVKMKLNIYGEKVILKETYKTGYIVTTPDLQGLYYCPTQDL
ncbi:MAG: hypothetical protein IKP45_03690 [Bacteroidales bacterium]|nr:hypothetical protein [Bacteroidales bacterium]